MRRSKLETFLAILETLASEGPLKLTHVMRKANVNSNMMKNYLDFLTKQGAVEERFVGKDRIVYAITKHGLELVRCFEDMKQVIATARTEIEISTPKTAEDHIPSRVNCWLPPDKCNVVPRRQQHMHKSNLKIM